MIRYQRAAGVNIDNTKGLPVIELTADGRTMGHIPGWASYISPEYVVSPTRVRERVVADTELFTGSAPTEATSDGATVFAPTPEESMQVNGETDINPDAYSVFFVARPTDVSQVQYAIRVRSDFQENNPFRIGFRANGSQIAFYDSPDGSGASLTYDGGYSDREGLSLLVVTFSTERGVSIFDNGRLVASDSEINTPPDSGYRASEWSYLFLARGLWGDLGVLNIDLSAPENTGYRRAIERRMRQKYVINGAA